MVAGRAKKNKQTSWVVGTYRLTRSDHRLIALAAAKARLSINAWLTQVCVAAAEAENRRRSRVVGEAAEG